MTQKDYSLAHGMQLLMSDFMLVFPFLISFIVAVILEAIGGAVASALAFNGIFATGNNLLLLPLGSIVVNSAILFVVILIEAFGVIWQSDAVSIRSRGYRFGLESSFRGALASIGKYARIMVFMAIIGTAINFIPIFGESLTNLWIAYSAYALMISSLTGRTFYDAFSRGADSLQKMYDSESVTGIFFALVIIVSVVPVISGLAILVEVILGSAAIVEYENKQG
ncbi:MAG: hypothetical protein ACYCT2_03855 [Thermoplasmataceae archaeon]